MQDTISDRKYILIKYRIVWYIGTVISFLLYFSGIILIYTFMRRRCFKKHVAIVLMYHRVGGDGSESDMTVSNENFERQIAFLKKQFKIVSLDEMVDLYKRKVQFREDTVAITFDDGFKDNYTCAYPMLKKYNVPAAIFVAMNYINKDYGLSQDEIKAMQENGIIFGAHTMTHKVLADLDKHNASLEIKDSKSALEQILGEEVRYFAYPYGRKGRDFTDETVQIVRDAGFSAAFATDNGFINNCSDIFALRRIGIRNFPLFVVMSRVSGIFENRTLRTLLKFTL